MDVWRLGVVWIKIFAMQTMKITAKPPMPPTSKAAGDSSIGNGRRGIRGKTHSVHEAGSAKKKLQECAENPTSECVVAAALSITKSMSEAWHWEDCYSAFSGIASAQAQLGDIESALATAQSIKVSYGAMGYRNKAFHNIALAQVELGNIKGALATVDSIEHVSKQRAFTLRDIALAQVELGNLDDAFTIAQSITPVQVELGNTYQTHFADLINISSQHSRATALECIASAQAKSGDISGALATAKIIKRISDTSELRTLALRNMAESLIRDIDTSLTNALLNIVSVQAELGDIDGALATTQSIHRATALGRIAMTQAKSGDIDGALTTARNIDDCSSVFSNIALEQARSGDVNGALATAREIPGMDARVKLMHDLALTQVEAGDKQSARNILAEALSIFQANVGDKQSMAARATLLHDLALAQVKAGDKQSARNILAEALSIFQANVGDKQSAQSTWDHVCNARSRVKSLSAIALGQAKAGDKCSARSTFAEALSITRNISAHYIEITCDRADIFCSIALAQVEAKDQQAARDTIAAALLAAKTIANTSVHARVLCDIARVQAQMGDAQLARDTFVVALSVVQGIDKPNYRAENLCAVALAQAQTGDEQSARDTFADALRVAQIKKPRRAVRARAEDLRDIAKTQAKLGYFRDAIKTVIEIKEDYVRVQTLLAVAKHLAERPNPEQKRKKPPSKRACVVSDESTDPEIIRKVEKTAVAHVRKILRAEGWRVVSVETMKRGYDLHCVQPDKEMHVEVKGTRGDEPSFMLTRGEHKRAESDPKFALYLVLRALDAPRLVVFSGEDLLRKFDFQTVQYKATEK